MSDRIDSRLVVDALVMAVARRLRGAGLVAHSGRGSQYAGGGPWPAAEQRAA